MGRSRRDMPDNVRIRTMMRIVPSPAFVVAAALPLIFALAACQPAGQDTNKESERAAASGDADMQGVDWKDARHVPVELSDFHIEIGDQLAAGPTIFDIENHGSTVHSFVLDGQGIKKRLLPDVVPGGHSTFRAVLKPGEYFVFCPIAQHAQRGMRERLVISK